MKIHMCPQMPILHANVSGESDLLTFCAPPERDSDAVIEETSRLVRENPLFRAIIEAVDGYLMILNPRRQILAVNRHFMEDMQLDSPICLNGSRPGEVLGCIHAAEGPGGCGTCRACGSCGALLSILASQRGESSVEECLTTVESGGALHAREFRVRSSPVVVEGRMFTIMVLNDISNNKRREALERTFFHDILNTLGGLLGWCNLLQEGGGRNVQRIIGRISQLSMRLKDEIEDHRRLSAAEHGTLSVNMQSIPVAYILGSVRALFEAHEVAKGRTLDVPLVSIDEQLTTDAILLLRVLSNMIKNALEAVPEGATVRVWFERDGGGIPIFYVHNPGVIPEEVRPRLFQRSFSTKSQRGRGIGGYSMKLFGERYLNGQINFTSTAEAGTTFLIRLRAE